MKWCFGVEVCRSFADKRAFVGKEGEVADGEKRLCVVCLCRWYQKWEYLTLADAPVSELLQEFDM